jgi:hypothetical protein
MCSPFQIQLKICLFCAQSRILSDRPASRNPGADQTRASLNRYLVNKLAGVTWVECLLLGRRPP